MRLNALPAVAFLVWTSCTPEEASPNVLYDAYGCANLVRLPESLNDDFMEVGPGVYEVGGKDLIGGLKEDSCF
jgi:hypothetical protein